MFHIASSPGRESSSDAHVLTSSIDSSASRRPLTQDLEPEVLLREGSPLPLIPPSQVRADTIWFSLIFNLLFSWYIHRCL